MTRTVTRTGWMYSQDRMRVRWMRGRVRRVARLVVGLTADDDDEGAVVQSVRTWDVSCGLRCPATPVTYQSDITLIGPCQGRPSQGADWGEYGRARDVPDRLVRQVPLTVAHGINVKAMTCVRGDPAGPGAQPADAGRFASLDTAVTAKAGSYEEDGAGAGHGVAGTTQVRGGHLAISQSNERSITATPGFLVLLVSGCTRCDWLGARHLLPGRHVQPLCVKPLVERPVMGRRTGPARRSSRRCAGTRARAARSRSWR